MTSERKMQPKAYFGEAPKSTTIDSYPTRRQLITGSLAFLATGLGKKPEETRAEASPDAFFGLPVLTDRQDPRLGEGKSIEEGRYIRQTKIAIDESLISSPPDQPIEDIVLNEKFSKHERRNRVDLTMLDGLIRAHALSENFFDKYDHSKIVELLQSGKLPPEPDWSSYLQRIASKESLIIPIMALPKDAPIGNEYLEWVEADMRQGVKLNFVGHDGNFQLNSGIDGWTIRIDENKGIQFDLFMDTSVLTPTDFPDRQLLYDSTYSTVVLHALQCASMTLGIRDSDGSTLYGKHFVNGYLDELRKNNGTGIFPDQTALFLGEPVIDPELGYYVGFSEPALHIKLQN